jgi:hypothetical protein
MEFIVTRFFIRREHNTHTSNTWILSQPERNHSVGHTRVEIGGTQRNDKRESSSKFYQKSSQ